MSNENSNDLNGVGDLRASLSTLVLSIGSSASMSLGLTAHPETNTTAVDLKMARFNIDLLQIIKEKTQNNLNSEENHLLNHMLSDLQLKFVEVQSKS